MCESKSKYMNLCYSVVCSDRVYRLGDRFTVNRKHRDTSWWTCSIEQIIGSIFTISSDQSCGASKLCENIHQSILSQVHILLDWHFSTIEVFRSVNLNKTYFSFTQTSLEQSDTMFSPFLNLLHLRISGLLHWRWVRLYCESRDCTGEQLLDGPAGLGRADEALEAVHPLGEMLGVVLEAGRVQLGQAQQVDHRLAGGSPALKPDTTIAWETCAQFTNTGKK